MKVLTFTEFINEQSQDKDVETGVKKMDKSNIPKADQLRALAKELYQSTIDAFQTQFKTRDKLSKLKKFGAKDSDITDAQADGAIQMAEIMLRATNIEQQMTAIGNDENNPKLADLAVELAGSAKQLANKENQKYFVERAKKKEKAIIRAAEKKDEEDKKKKEDGESDDKKSDDKKK